MTDTADINFNHCQQCKLNFPLYFLFFINFSHINICRRSPLITPLEVYIYIYSNPHYSFVLYGISHIIHIICMQCTISSEAYPICILVVAETVSLIYIIYLRTKPSSQHSWDDWMQNIQNKASLCMEAQIFLKMTLS